ncbi:TetR/AcrR family transcriptional regulator [Caldibacillus debilis]|uniref:TetR/AcrR family transcriptional regulator n=1 Tax=Caldibacillus debilis TaxID=301148 RepID=UPI0009EDA5C5
MRDEGHRAPTISDLLKAANIGKGLFYHNFSSKHDLGLPAVDNLAKDWRNNSLGIFWTIPATPLPS